MSRRGIATAMMLVALGASTGCGASHAAAHQPSGGHAPADPSASAAAAASPSPTPMLTPTAPAATPLGAGERVWLAFSQRGLSYDAWWAHLRPQLSDAARAEYVYDDPRNLPAMSLTGKIHLAAKAPAEPKYTAEVVVPTSKGVFGLDLERHTIGSPWLLYAIRFPPGVR